MKKLLFALLTLALVLSSPVFAQDQDTFDFDKLRISLGAFFPGAETTVRLDASNGALGTTIKFEDDLGVSTKEGLFRLDGYWRPKRRHRLDFGYYDFNRSGARLIDATINFGDQTFNINTQVNSLFDIRIIKIAYTYLAVAKEKTTVGLSIGFNISHIDVGISTTGGLVSQFRNTGFPVPVIGINASHDLGEGFSLEGAAQFFYIDLGSEDGRLFDGRVAVLYRIVKNVGVGVGYNYFAVIANKTGTNFTGRFKLNYDGIQVFLNIFF